MDKVYYELEDARKRKKCLIASTVVLYMGFVATAIMTVLSYVMPEDPRWNNKIIVLSIVTLLFAVYLTYALRVKYFKRLLLITESDVGFIMDGYSQKYLYSNLKNYDIVKEGTKYTVFILNFESKSYLVSVPNSLRFKATLDKAICSKKNDSDR
jgi:hypothetical protein